MRTLILFGVVLYVLSGCDHGPVISYPPQYYQSGAVSRFAAPPPVFLYRPSVPSAGFYQKECDPSGRCSILEF